MVHPRIGNHRPAVTSTLVPFVRFIGVPQVVVYRPSNDLLFLQSLVFNARHKSPAMILARPSFCTHAKTASIDGSGLRGRTKKPAAHRRSMLEIIHIESDISDLMSFFVNCLGRRSIEFNNHQKTESPTCLPHFYLSIRQRSDVISSRGEAAEPQLKFSFFQRANRLAPRTIL
jgi:hypothetical protein